MSPESLPFVDYKTKIMDYAGHLSCFLHRYEAWNKPEEAEKWLEKLPKTEAKIE